MNVTHVLPSFEIGGQEVFVRHLVAELVAQGISCSVLGLSGGGPLEPAFRAAGAAVYVLAQHNALPGYPAALIRHLRTLAPDVVHSHSGTWFPTVVAGRRLRIPVVHTEHGRYPDEPWWVAGVDRLSAGWTARLVMVSEQLSSDLARRIPKGRTVEVIANGITVPPLPTADSRAGLRDDLGIPVGKMVIGTVGRLAPVKDHDAFLRMLALIRQRRPDVIGVLVGDGPLRARLEDTAAELGLGDSIRFTGFRADAAIISGAFDVFVCSSTTEGTPIAVMEALAMACPVVATDVGGLRALLADGVAGILVPRENVAALAAEVTTLLNDPDAAKALGARGREHMVVQHSMSACAERYARIYREIAGRAGVPGPSNLNRSAESTR